jgi:hypothetical protein
VVWTPYVTSSGMRGLTAEHVPWGRSVAETLAVDTRDDAVLVRAAAQGHVGLLASQLADVVRWLRASGESNCRDTGAPAAGAAFAAAAISKHLACVWLLWHVLPRRGTAQSLHASGAADDEIAWALEALGVPPAELQLVHDAIVASAALAREGANSAADVAPVPAAAVSNATSDLPTAAASRDDDDDSQGAKTTLVAAPTLISRYSDGYYCTVTGFDLNDTFLGRPVVVVHYTVRGDLSEGALYAPAASSLVHTGDDGSGPLWFAGQEILSQTDHQIVGRFLFERPDGPLGGVFSFSYGQGGYSPATFRVVT